MPMELPERLVMAFIGGPLYGRIMTELPWPLPETFDVPDRLQPETRGVYVKMSESTLEERVPGIQRGAVYHWLPIIEVDA